MSGPRRARTARGFFASCSRVERMVVAERLAPVRQREVRLRLLRQLELGDRLLPAEAVQDGHAAQEVPLRLRRRRRRKRERADVLELADTGPTSTQATTTKRQAGRQRMGTSERVTRPILFILLLERIVRID